MRSPFCCIYEQKVERIVRTPPAAVLAAPDQPAAPRATLTQPQKRPRPRPPIADDLAPRAPANNVTANYRQDAWAASGGGHPGIDADPRRARRRERWLRGTTPRLGTAPLARERRGGSTCRAASAAGWTFPVF
jgi:hypothetical protein